ncbi:MAG TPA: hypothetical protein VMZ31_14305 [Phycisphaerae bacterium]|nr:hypothetical protein [Phycisphaerae bacterium]
MITSSRCLSTSAISSAAHPFDAIQEGINAALNGETVLVLDGEYTGVGNYDLDFGGRLITVRSAGGAASCIIDCQGLGRGFYFHSGETAAAVVEGFTITNGRASGGGGMSNFGGSPTVTQCTFSGNSAGWGKLSGQRKSGFRGQLGYMSDKNAEDYLPSPRSVLNYS